MMKHLYKLMVSFFCMTLLAPVRAEKVDVGKAQSVAQRFVQTERQFSGRDVRLRLTHTSTSGHGIKRNNVDAQQDTVFYYVFNVNEDAGGGFVIVAGDDRVTPILGYTGNGSYDGNSIPPNFAGWEEFIQQEIRCVMSQDMSPAETVRKRWNSETSAPSLPIATSVEPLITTKWNQGAPFNNLCPEYQGKRCVTGCTATAMAQIMNYHRNPVRGTGASVAYLTDGLRIPVPSYNFEIDYDWDSMLDSYSGGYTEQQATAVATLMVHCGASLQANYAPGETGGFAYRVMWQLPEHFGYDNIALIIARSWYATKEEWENVLRKQLDAGLPIFHEGFREGTGGHAFVCDGYATDGTFHFNWGWGGSCDGYFVSELDNPVSCGFWNLSRTVIINIMPDKGGAHPCQLLLDDFSVSKSHLKHNETFTVSTQIYNTGDVNYPGGDLGVALLDDNDNIVEILGTIPLSPLVIRVATSRLTVNCNVSDAVALGTYKLRLVIRHTGKDWEIMWERRNASSTFALLRVVDEFFTPPDPDRYEPNNSIGTATNLNFSFVDNRATIITTGSNFHAIDDVDYYFLVLPLGAQYTVAARLYDAYSGDGSAYNADAKFRYRKDNGIWSEYYDDALPENIVSENGGCILYFHVAPFLPGEIGDYLLEIKVERTASMVGNANLKMLWVNQGVLSPTFDPETTDYAVEVENKVASINIIATPESANAMVQGAGVHQLNVGSNVINLTVTAQDLTPNTYTVTVTRKEILEIISGVHDNVGEPLTAWPNPAGNYIIVGGLRGGGTLTVLDAAGRQLFRRNTVSTQETISLHDLPKGNYFVQIVEGESVRAIKIVVQ